MVRRRIISPSKAEVRRQKAEVNSSDLGWCPGPDSNRHVAYAARDFKSRASTNFATGAFGDILRLGGRDQGVARHGFVERDQGLTRSPGVVVILRALVGLSARSDLIK